MLRENPQLVLPAMWPTVSIVQKKNDLVLEDIEQDVDKEIQQEEQQIPNTEDQQLAKKTVSLTHR